MKMKIKWIAIALLTVLLTGCVAAMVASASLMVYDRRSVRMIEKDARIFHVVHTAIVTDPNFHGSRVKVSVYQQVVLLLGQVKMASLKSLAEEIAQTTPNVRRVYNKLTIANPIDLEQQSTDIWITSQVRSKMLAKKDLESGSIQVNTENSIVYLTGVVTPEQANLAVSAARTVNGVRQVVKMFQYIR
ncbi:MAG TPA: BON domain-containing protein [Legionellaceae bacterium]|nr:BON domain-containing protein [Legionellaceae bacterium]